MSKITRVTKRAPPSAFWWERRGAKTFSQCRDLIVYFDDIHEKQEGGGRNPPSPPLSWKATLLCMMEGRQCNGHASIHGNRWSEGELLMPSGGWLNKGDERGWGGLRFKKAPKRSSIWIDLNLAPPTSKNQTRWLLIK